MTDAHRVQRIALVVGNGFTTDLTKSCGLTGFAHSTPLDWFTEIPGTPGLTLAEALPEFSHAMSSLRASNANRSHFDLLREVVGPADRAGSHTDSALSGLRLPLFHSYSR